ncbi:unnamed protein product [Lathyrus sativus]|nr:unnamed protein product [Lathyrus sativus]
MSSSVVSKDFGEVKDARAIFAIWDCGSPLYDSCELVTLSHIVERQMMEWPYLGGSKQIIPKVFDLDEVKISSGNAKSSSKWINLSDFFEKISWKRKRNGKQRSTNKIEIEFFGFYSRFVCGRNKVFP